MHTSGAPSLRYFLPGSLHHRFQPSPIPSTLVSSPKVDNDSGLSFFVPESRNCHQAENQKIVRIISFFLLKKKSWVRVSWLLVTWKHLYLCNIFATALYFCTGVYSLQSGRESLRAIEKEISLPSHYLFLFLWPHLWHMEGSSQARGEIGAAAAGLCHSHSNTRSELHL